MTKCCLWLCFTYFYWKGVHMFRLPLVYVQKVQIFEALCVEICLQH